MKYYVYVVPLTNKTAFKVGKSRNLKKRIGTLSRYYDFDLESAFVIECESDQAAYSIESLIHQTLDDKRLAQPLPGGTEFFNFEFFNYVVGYVDFLSVVKSITKLPFPVVEKEPTAAAAIDDVYVLLQRVGHIIKTTRLEKNISQESISNICDVGRSTYSKAEQGLPISSDTLLKILITLGLDTTLRDLIPVDITKKRAS